MKTTRFVLLALLGSTLAGTPAHAFWPFRQKAPVESPAATATTSKAMKAEKPATASGPGTTHSSVIRLAPDFTFPGAGKRSLRSLKGQPVVLVITKSPETKAFKKQLKQLRRGYSQFASRQAVFVVALLEGNGPVESNVPFVVASNGPAVANAYGLKGDFCVAIIGRDGNLDYQTANPLPPERIVDVMQNAFPVQNDGRKENNR